jgi:hypothetical protein
MQVGGTYIVEVTKVVECVETKKSSNTDCENSHNSDSLLFQIATTSSTG